MDSVDMPTEEGLAQIVAEEISDVAMQIYRTSQGLFNQQSLERNIDSTALCTESQIILDTALDRIFAEEDAVLTQVAISILLDASGTIGRARSISAIFSREQEGIYFAST